MTNGASQRDLGDGGWAMPGSEGDEISSAPAARYNVGFEASVRTDPPRRFVASMTRQEDGVQ